VEFFHIDTCASDEVDDIDPLLMQQLLAAIASANSDLKSWQSDHIGFEVWDVRDNGMSRFRLIFFPDSDSGMLFHHGTADSAGLVLWPHGFEQKGGVPAIDADVLTAAYKARPR